MTKDKLINGSIYGLGMFTTTVLTCIAGHELNEFANTDTERLFYLSSLMINLYGVSKCLNSYLEYRNNAVSSRATNPYRTDYTAEGFLHGLYIGSCVTTSFNLFKRITKNQIQKNEDLSLSEQNVCHVGEDDEGIFSCPIPK